MKKTSAEEKVQVALDGDVADAVRDLAQATDKSLAAVVKMIVRITCIEGRPDRTLKDVRDHFDQMRRLTEEARAGSEAAAKVADLWREPEGPFKGGMAK